MDSTTKNGRVETIDLKVPGEVQSVPSPVQAPLLPIAPKLMLVFWMILGAVAGISLGQGIWRMAGWKVGAFALALPVGAVTGAVGGGLVGRITQPHLLVLVMATLAGWSVGSLGGGLAWAETGQIAGGFTGALGGGLIWAVWLLTARGEKAP